MFHYQYLSTREKIHFGKNTFKCYIKTVTDDEKFDFNIISQQTNKRILSSDSHEIILGQVLVFEQIDYEKSSDPTTLKLIKLIMSFSRKKIVPPPVENIEFFEVDPPGFSNLL